MTESHSSEASSPRRSVRLSRGAFFLSLLAFLTLPVAGLGTRFGFWSFKTGLALLGAAPLAGLLAFIIALVLIRKKRTTLLYLAALLGLIAFAMPLRWFFVAKSVPMIHDISTDTDHPPVFEKVLDQRKDALNSAEYQGPELASQQHQAYPDLKSVKLSQPPQTIFPVALEVARDQHWQIVDSAPERGRIEATDTTLWFGFKDDIVIRLLPDGSGSVLDVRSLSRVGKSDVGQNAKRIRGFLRELAARVTRLSPTSTQ